ncbi:MAG: hypothetical protein AAF557_17195 [Pseudomonadota bacterium]
MTAIDRFWIAQKIEGRPSVLAELAQHLRLPIEDMGQLLRGERDVTVEEAQALQSFFDGEGFLSCDLSNDQKKMLELTFQLTDQEIRYLLESARAQGDGQGPHRE